MPEKYLITHCTVADAPDVAHHSMHAFWQDPNWRMLWRPAHARGGLPFVVAQATARGPRGLLRDRGRLRHYKAVDAATGRFVGYIRWRLPVRHGGSEEEAGGGSSSSSSGPVCWSDGQTPDVSPEERDIYDRRAEAAWWETDPSGDVLDGPMKKIRDDLLAKKEYIGTRIPTESLLSVMFQSYLSILPSY